MSMPDTEDKTIAVMVEVTTRLTEMGIQVQLRTPGVTCTYDFDQDATPELVLGLIGSSSEIVQHQMIHLCEQTEKEE
jgi:hypothetical protein